MPLKYDEPNNAIEAIEAGDRIVVTLKLKQTGTEYKIISQQFMIITPDSAKSAGPFDLPVNSSGGGSKSDSHEQSSLVPSPSQLQHTLLKGGKRRFSNSNRMNIRRVYNRTMSRRD